MKNLKLYKGVSELKSLGTPTLARILPEQPIGDVVGGDKYFG